MGPAKVREDRARRKLHRMGFRLMKSRARDPADITYGGFLILSLGGKNGVVAGEGNQGRGYALGVDGIEAWIARRERV